MELDYPKRAPVRRNPNLWLQMTLLVGFIFCLLVGIGALTTLALFRVTPEPPRVTGAPGNLTLARIAPQHAVSQLAGDPAQALAAQAVAAGESDLAAAIALYSVELLDSARLTTLLQAARRAPAQDAVAILHAARTIAVTSPALHHGERSQALFQIADSLADAEANAEAVDVARQALRVAAQTPELLPAQRIQLAEPLLRLANELGHTELRAEVNALLRNPYLTPSGSTPAADWLTLSEPFGEPLDAMPDVAAAISIREQAATALVQRLILTGGIDYEPERVALALALRQEEEVRTAAFQAAVGAATTPGQQLTLLDQRRAWTALKLRIAYGAVGMEIVPEWSANLPALHQEYAAIANNMVTVIDALTAAGDNTVAQTALRFQAQMWLAQQAELGLYRDRPSAEIDARLRQLQAELAALGAPFTLPVAFDAQAVPPGFRIGPALAAP